MEIANKHFPSLTFKLSSNGQFHDKIENAEKVTNSLSVNEVNYIEANSFYGKPKYADQVSASDSVENKIDNTNSSNRTLRSPKNNLTIKTLSIEEHDQCQRQVNVHNVTSSEKDDENNPVLSPRLCLLPKRKRSFGYEEEVFEEKTSNEISPNSKRKKGSKCSREVSKLAADEWKEMRHQGFHPADLLSDQGEIVYLRFDDDSSSDDNTSEKNEEETPVVEEADESTDKENTVEVAKPKKKLSR